MRKHRIRPAKQKNCRSKIRKESGSWSRSRTARLVIALAINGNMLDSVELAERIDKLGIGGVSQLVFVIGGSLGLPRPC